MAKPITVKILGDADQFQRSIGQVNSAIGGFAGTAGKLGAVIGGVFAVDRVAGFFKGSIGAASDLNETVSKTGVIFGENAGEIESWADTAVDSFGQSKRSALEAATTFATFGKAAGLTGTDLTAFSTKMTELSSDLASFHNSSPEEAIEAIGAALRGEAEPIRRYGVLLDDATLRQQALKMGLIDTVKDALTPAQKSLAAYEVILAQTTDAQGDYQRTADGTANTERRLAAEWENSKAAVGQALLPAYGQLLGAVSDLIPVMEQLLPPITEVVGGLIGFAGAALGAVASAGDLLSVLGSFGAGGVVAYVGVMKTVEGVQAAQAAFAGMVGTLGTLTGALAGIALIAGGAAAVGFFQLKREQAEAKAAQESLTDAYRQAGDPTTLLIDRLAALKAELLGVADASGDAEGAATVATEGWATMQAQQRGVIDTTNRLNLSSTQLFDSVRDGTDVFGAAASAMRTSADNTDFVRRSIQNYTQVEQQRVGVILRAVDAGRISRDEATKLLAAMDEMSDASDDHAEAMAAEARAAIQVAIATGNVSESWLRQHGIVDQNTASVQQWIQAGEALADLNPALADSSDAVAGAVDGQTTAIDSAEQAAKDFEAALEELKTSQDAYVTQSVDYAGAFDAVMSSINAASEATTEAEGDFWSYSEAAIDARDKNREVIASAAEFVAQMAAQGQSTEAQRQALATLAQSYYDNAIAAGYPADEAARIRDNILAIPTSKDVTITVTQHLQTIGSLAMGVAGAVFGERAYGGATSGGMYRVGERGPETVFLPQGAHVEPNHSGGGQAGGSTINVTAQTNADPWSIAREVEWALRTAGR